MMTRRGMWCLFVVAVLVATSLSAAGQTPGYNESPMLTDLVEQGLLPPVEERLPDNPKVMNVTEEIGVYGGTMRRVFTTVGSDAQMRMMNAEFMLESIPFPTLDEATVTPNIIESWSVDDSAQVFTLTIRKGLKWSDGHPVTTEDIRFYFEDVLQNEELTSVFPAFLTSGGQPAKLNVIDTHTFQYEFAAPYGLFILKLQSQQGTYNNFLLPAHYMKQFHPDYTPMDELHKMLAAEGLSEDEWCTLFNANNFADPWNVAGIGFPTLHPWMVVEEPSASVTILERNPYYWKVDEAGNQLPYIDRIRMELVEDGQMVNMKIIAGELDFEMGGGGLSLADLPLFREYEESGGYTCLLVPPTTLTTPVLYFPNYTYPDPVWQEIIGDRRFRIALSLGINRDEINSSIFLGLGEPVQSSDLAGSPFMEDWFRTSYTEYDPERANQLLDEMGLDKRDAEGWRLRPDGQRLKLPLEFFRVNSHLVPVSELVVEYWRDLGIDATMQLIGGGLWISRQGANETIMSAWQENNVDPGNPFLWFVPIDPLISYSFPWGQWFATNGEEGTEPPDEIKELWDLYVVVKETPDNDERLAAGKQILRSQAENLWNIGTVGNVPNPVIVSNRLGNIPAWSICTQWGLPMAEQVFFKDAQ